MSNTMGYHFEISFKWNGKSESFIFPVDDNFYQSWNFSTLIAHFKNSVKSLEFDQFIGLPDVKFIVKRKSTNSIIHPACKLQLFRLNSDERQKCYSMEDLYMEVIKAIVVPNRIGGYSQMTTNPRR